jgi:hypothetical protein
MSNEDSSASSAAKLAAADCLHALLHHADHFITHHIPSASEFNSLAEPAATLEILKGVHEGFECAKHQDWNGFTQAMVSVAAAAANGATHGGAGLAMAAFDAAASVQRLGGATGTFTAEQGITQLMITAQNHLVELAIQITHPGADRLDPSVNNLPSVELSKVNGGAAEYFEHIYTGMDRADLHEGARVVVHESDIQISTSTSGGNDHPGHPHHHAHADSRSVDLGSTHTHAHAHATPDQAAHATMNISPGDVAAYSGTHANADSRSAVTTPDATQHPSYHGSVQLSGGHANPDSHSMNITVQESRELATGHHSGGHTILEQLHHPHEHHSLVPQESAGSAAAPTSSDAAHNQADPAHPHG